MTPRNRQKAPRRSASGNIKALPIAAALLLLLAFQAAGNSVAHSAAFDELYQLSAGYAYLRTGDTRLNNDHPPLSDAWVALPLMLLAPRLPLESPAWQQAERGSFGDTFVWQANPGLALAMFRLARLPNIALSLLLGTVIFRWVSDLANRTAGLLALALYALDPAIVAHASLSTNDLGAAALIFYSAWAWWKWLESPSLARLIVAGLLAGGACTSKYSGLIIAPIMFLLAMLHRPAAGLPRLWLRRVVGLAGAAVVCMLTIWAVYRFDAAPFWTGIRFQGGRLAHGQPVYALGKVWPDGVWFYYPLALLLKTPLPTLILCGAGLFAAIKQRANQFLLFLLAPPLLFGLVALGSDLQLGHRYLLPMLPFLFSLAGYTAATPLSWRKPGFWSTALLLLWLILDAAVIYPHHLSFFNALAGGANEADRYLVDSNLDWGQDLPALKRTMEERNIPCVYLGYFGSAVPNAYGISYWPSPGFLRFVGDAESMAFNPYTPDPGWHAISRTSLRQGLVLTHHDLYTRFRSRPLDAHAGYSINLYYVEYPPETPVVRAVVQGTRTADIPAEQLGWHEGQRLIVKWTRDNNTLILPMNGSARHLTTEPIPCIPALRDALFAHARPTPGGGVELDARPVVQPWLEHPSLWMPDGTPLVAPAEFEGDIRLVGYHIGQTQIHAGDTLSLALIWQISGEPRPPLASFVHLLGTDGMPISQHDGWGTALRGLEIGDIVVQCVYLPIPPDARPGFQRLQVGLYSPATMTRWQIPTPPQGSIDRVWLPEIEIQ